MNERIRKGKGYHYMLNIIETLMRDSNVVSGKVGISGYKEDVAAYLAALLEVYFYKDIELYLMDDINEFDPDILPNKFR
jgi:hypothetical protein